MNDADSLRYYSRLWRYAAGGLVLFSVLLNVVAWVHGWWWENDTAGLLLFFHLLLIGGTSLLLGNASAQRDRIQGERNQ